MVRTIYEDGYSWVEVDDEAWARAEFMDYAAGIPLMMRRR